MYLLSRTLILLIISFFISTYSFASEPNAHSLHQININNATIEQIANSLKGIGTKKAKAIVDYREKFGDFETIDELIEVKGIGKKITKINRERITLD